MTKNKGHGKKDAMPTRSSTCTKPSEAQPSEAHHSDAQPSEAQPSEAQPQIVMLTEECPEGFNPIVWRKLLAIEANTAGATSRLDTLEDRVERLEVRCDQIQLLAAKVARLETSKVHLRDETRDLKHHSMKYNLVFSFDDATDIGKEVEGEDTESVLREFLKSAMSTFTSQWRTD